MTPFVPVLSTLLVLLPAAVGAQAPAKGMNLAGRWQCAANGNIPIAALQFKGNQYVLEDTPNGAYQAKPGKLNGKGNLKMEAAGFVPTSGPLVSELEIKEGAYHEDRNGRVIYLNNKPGGMSLLFCYPR